MPSVFDGGDAGVAAMHRDTGWQLMFHNRWWANDTVYGGLWVRENHSVAYPGNAMALPLDESFWHELLKEAQTLGLTTLFMDWLWTEFLGMEVTQRTATAATEWLRRMSCAAERLDITILYCMVLPRHVVASAEFPAVTQVRVSDDYGPGARDDQWRIGRSSILAHALRLAPYKDGFLTLTLPPGGAIRGTEFNPELQAAVATLSAGPVTINDGADLTNASLVAMSCRSDGMILKPARPATALDQTLREAAFSPSSGPWNQRSEVWGTYSEVSGLRWLHVLAADLQASVDISLAELSQSTLPPESPEITGSWIGFTTAHGGGTFEAWHLDASGSINLSPRSLPDFQVIHVAPVMSNGWAMLGDLSKWVPTSAQRFFAVTAQDDHVLLLVHTSSAAPEELSFDFARVGSWSVEVFSVNCTGRIVPDNPCARAYPAQGRCDPCTVSVEIA